jgi:hypothetical protein
MEMSDLTIKEMKIGKLESDTLQGSKLTNLSVDLSLSLFLDTSNS